MEKIKKGYVAPKFATFVIRVGQTVMAASPAFSEAGFEDIEDNGESFNW